MNKLLTCALTLSVALATSGCAVNKIVSTPASMTYDGSSVDYSKIDSMKHATVCKEVVNPEGDTTVIAAAKAGGISKIKHVDISYESSVFFIWPYSVKNCVTVYGQ